jgi:hypothetical protein
MSASLEQVGTNDMTRDEQAFCDYINAGLRNRGLEVHFSYVRRKSTGGFDFDLVENIGDERYLDVFDGLTVNGWIRYHESRGS